MVIEQPEDETYFQSIAANIDHNANEDEIVLILRNVAEAARAEEREQAAKVADAMAEKYRKGDTRKNLKSSMYRWAAVVLEETAAAIRTTDSGAG